MAYDVRAYRRKQYWNEPEMGWYERAYLFEILRESGELSAVILIVVSLAGIFAFSLSTLGVIDPVTKAIVNSGLGEWGVMALIVASAIAICVPTQRVRRPIKLAAWSNR